MQIPGKLVVRVHAPARRWTILGSLLLLVAVALFLAFEIGHQKAGFDGITASQQRSALQSRLAAQDQTIHEMRVQLAADASTQISQVRERSELARTIGELQAGLARAQQDLEFYRAIANPVEASRQGSVHVQQFRVLTADPALRAFTLRFALNRPTRPEETTSGTLGVTIDGERSGTAASLTLVSLTADKTKQLPYSFRYFTNVEQLITLPADFKAERVTIEIRSAQKSTPPYRQTFVWNPDTA
ncbi:MAG TPA: DUF6776 family protein [Steroidobacteraceae bacterium]|nr:DUF6776 family protein [Steroidobacteraceae bacterium]